MGLEGMERVGGEGGLMGGLTRRKKKEKREKMCHRGFYSRFSIHHPRIPVSYPCVGC